MCCASVIDPAIPQMIPEVTLLISLLSLASHAPHEAKDSEASAQGGTCQ